MAIDVATFVTRFPEFTSAASAEVTVVLAEAQRRVDQAVFDDKYEEAVFYKAAHLLAISPFGRNARMVSKAGTTTYHTAFNQLAREVTPGFRVA